MKGINRKRMLKHVESSFFQKTILLIIIINGILLGLLTLELPPTVYALVTLGDMICIGFFVVEICIRLYARGWKFFSSGWRNFDFIVVAISVLPFGHAFSVLRTIRAIRVMRLISTLPNMRKAVKALLYSLPGVASAGGLLLLFFYVFSIIGHSLFSEAFPEYFGHLGRTWFTLFQIMTLESWAMGIVRPIMEEFPHAWIYFILFILLSTYLLVNLLIGIIVDAISHFKFERLEKSTRKTDSKQNIRMDEIQKSLDKIDRKLNKLSKAK